jgi:hypothetical protein
MTARERRGHWVDALARGATKSAGSRNYQFGQRAQPASLTPPEIPPGELVADMDRRFTRRTTLKIVAGALAAFVAPDLGPTAMAGARSAEGGNCLANCRNDYYNAIKGVELKSILLIGVPGTIVGAYVGFLYRSEVTCPNECGPPGPSSSSPPGTTPPPASVPCPQGFQPCNGGCINPGTIICCPPESTALYCSVGETCCSDHCVLSGQPC